MTTPDLMTAISAGGRTIPDPVIVTGAPRTGVRLVAAVLDGHPALASGPDLPVVATLVQQWRQIDAELGFNHDRHHGIPPEASREAFRAAALKLFAPRLQLAGKKHFVLQSFTAALLLEPFAALFPTARFIFMTRDPAGIARSLLRCDWRDARNGQRLPYTRDPAAAARFSSDFMSLAMRSTPALEASGRLMTLPYEELCSNPRAAMERVGAFLHDSAPEPRVLAGSAILVTKSPDNPHPPLRAGAVDSRSTARLQ